MPDPDSHLSSGVGGEKRFKSTTRWENGAELVIEKFPAPDLFEANRRAGAAGRLLWPDVRMVFLGVEEVPDA